MRGLGPHSRCGRCDLRHRAAPVMPTPLGGIGLLVPALLVPALLVPALLVPTREVCACACGGLWLVA